MPGYSFFKSEGENYGNVKSIYTRDIRLYIFDKASKTSIFGNALAVSHLEIACLDIFNFLAKSS